MHTHQSDHRQLQRQASSGVSGFRCNWQGRCRVGGEGGAEGDECDPDDGGEAGDSERQRRVEEEVADHRFMAAVSASAGTTVSRQLARAAAWSAASDRASRTSSATQASLAL